MIERVYFLLSCRRTRTRNIQAVMLPRYRGSFADRNAGMAPAALAASCRHPSMSRFDWLIRRAAPPSQTFRTCRRRIQFIQIPRYISATECRRASRTIQVCQISDESHVTNADLQNWPVIGSSHGAPDASVEAGHVAILPRRGLYDPKSMSPSTFRNLSCTHPDMFLKRRRQIL